MVILSLILIVGSFEQSGAISSSHPFVTEWGSPGSGDVEFLFPNSIAVDDSGNIYITDEGNHKVKKFDNDVASQYLEKIKKYSKKYAVLADKIQGVINPYTSLIDACVILPAKLATELVSSFIEFQKKINRKK